MCTYKNHHLKLLEVCLMYICQMKYKLGFIIICMASLVGISPTDTRGSWERSLHLSFRTRPHRQHSPSTNAFLSRDTKLANLTYKFQQIQKLILNMSSLSDRTETISFTSGDKLSISFKTSAEQHINTRP